jgi:MtN3 and saliva related transmembrane protein
MWFGCKDPTCAVTTPITMSAAADAGLGCLQGLDKIKEVFMGIYPLKTDSPAHLRWLRIFEPLMVVTGIVQPLATLPSISKLYFTHSEHASGQSLTTWSIFALASFLWVCYGMLNRKPAIYVGNIIGLLMNLVMVNGIMLNAGWTY